MGHRQQDFNSELTKQLIRYHLHSANMLLLILILVQHKFVRAALKNLLDVLETAVTSPSNHILLNCVNLNTSCFYDQEWNALGPWIYLIGNHWEPMTHDSNKCLIEY